MSKKNIMKEFLIDEISAVDTPAQKGARALIMKRDAANGGDPTSKATKEKIMADDNQAAIQKAVKEATDKLEATQKAAVEKLTAELGLQSAIAKMSDAEKAFYNKQDEAGKAAFLKMTDEEKKKKAEEDAKAEAAKKSDSNPVIYKAANGDEFRKNDDPRLIDMAKRADALEKANKEEFEKRQNAEFEKRAGAELNHLPGELVAKVAVLKAIDGIKDEAAKKSAGELLKAANTAMSAAFKTIGVTKAADPQSPEAQLDTMAKRHAETAKVDYATAYDTVLKTAEGKALYSKIGIAA